MYRTNTALLSHIYKNSLVKEIYMAKISVVVPIYKTEEYLRRCVDSILNQTFSDFDLILVNDGSPDNSADIMEEYAKSDNRVIPLYKKNGGLSDARNAGIEYSFKNSDSLWITFVDSDDCIHPQYLELLYDAVIKQNTQISVGEILRFKEDLEVDDFISKSKFNLNSPENAYPLEKTTSEDLYFRYAHYGKRTCYVSAWGKLYKKSLFSEIRFPFGKNWEDIATTYKVFFSVNYCTIVDTPLYFYFDNSNGIMRSPWTPKRLDELDAYEQQLEFFKRQEKYKNIYKNLQFTYIEAISYSFNMLINSSQPPKEKKKYKKLLSKKIRKALRQYKEKIPLEKNIGIYETAYPRRMHLYWIFKRITRK